MIEKFLRQPFGFMIICFCVVEILNKAISGNIYGVDLADHKITFIIQPFIKYYIVFNWICLLKAVIIYKSQSPFLS